MTHALSKITRLRGVYFRWDDSLISSVGVIAQEVESFYPELISTNFDGVKHVNYQLLIPLLIESIRELSENLDLLAEKVEGFILETRN